MNDYRETFYCWHCGKKHTSEINSFCNACMKRGEPLYQHYNERTGKPHGNWGIATISFTVKFNPEEFDPDHFKNWVEEMHPFLDEAEIINVSSRRK